jgi:sec-independent protein translocase protein TatA
MNAILLPLSLGMPGGQEWILILLLVLIFFGAKRLPELARSLGKGVSEFKKALNEATREIEGISKEVHDTTSTESPSKPVEPAPVAKINPPADNAVGKS